MKYSVIIPCFHAADYFQRCVESLDRYKRKDYEILLTDDGSSDKTAMFSDEYAAVHKNCLVIHQKNAGASASRNRGIEIASGEYLLFVDSDDFVKESYFDSIDKSISIWPVDILLFGAKSSVSQSVPKEELNIIGNSNVKAYYKNNWNKLDFSSCWNKAFSRKLITENNIRFNEQTAVEEDHVFNLRALDRAESFAQITDILYVYDQKPFGSLTTRYNPQKFTQKLISYSEEIGLLTKWNADEIIHYQKQQLVSFVSAAINNLLYDECDLNYRQKIDLIRQYFSDPDVAECADTPGFSAMRAKVMAFLIRNKLYRTSYLLHAVYVKIIKPILQKKEN